MVYLVFGIWNLAYLAYLVYLVYLVFGIWHIGHIWMKYFFVQAANKCAETDSSGGKVGGEQQMCLNITFDWGIFWAEEMLRLLLLVFRKFMEGSKKD